MIVVMAAWCLPVSEAFEGAFEVSLVRPISLRRMLPRRRRGVNPGQSPQVEALLAELIGSMVSPTPLGLGTGQATIRATLSPSGSVNTSRQKPAI